MSVIGTIAATPFSFWVQHDACTITLDEIKPHNQVTLNFTRYASSYLCAE